MDTPSSVALSGQLVREQQMDVLANNIANLSTVGFKGQSMIFAELLTNTTGERAAYVRDAGTVRDWSQGSLTRTGNSLDVALQGSGFLEVGTPAGTRYTRDGRMKLDAQGQLVTLQGDPVLAQGDQPILIPQGSGTLTITQDGSISSKNGTIGQLAVVSFDQLQGLEAEQNGLYATDEGPTQSTDTKVVQGSIEESNVQAVLEMTRLMEASRAVSRAKTFQDNEADRHKNAIDRLAKTV
ncbi:MAG TPA: flagellar basal-body rod protein FlgF [Stellaceae bacterium]|nr:flagellar basal-body rod protein FlgF [Stellaceae bacterium]